MRTSLADVISLLGIGVAGTTSPSRPQAAVWLYPPECPDNNNFVQTSL
jgi:hypothetical protein